MKADTKLTVVMCWPVTEPQTAVEIVSFLMIQAVYVFNTPGVAGAVLQTALSFTQSVNQSVILFLQIFKI